MLPIIGLSFYSYKVFSSLSRYPDLGYPFQLVMVALPRSGSEMIEKKDLPRILMIDDNYDFFQSISPALGKDAVLEYAPDGFSAFQMIKREPFDVIVSDICMPMLSGMTLLQELHKKRIRTPVILISGNVDEATSTEALNLGAYNILQKPFSVAELLSKIQMAIKLHAENDQLELDDQEQAYIYNTLKMHYYDVEKIMRAIKAVNLQKAVILQELEKKEMTGKCLFDDLHAMKKIS